MSVYDHFATHYDAAYAAVDYDGDVDWLEQAFQGFSGRKVQRVLDLGSGTGSHAARLVTRGYDVDGVDLSSGLLEVAREKVPAARFHHADMARALPEGEWDAAISMFGSFCYLTRDEEVARLLALLAERIPMDGMFAFEFWNPYGFRPQQTWHEWTLPEGRRLLRIHRSAFDVVPDDVYRFSFEHLVLRGDSLEDRFTEEHALRLRTPAATARLLKENGWEIAHFSTGRPKGKTLEPPAADDFRVMAIARRSG